MRRSIVDFLNKFYGGKWRFNRHSHCWENDNGRYVIKYHSCEDIEFCQNCYKQYCMYKPNEIPEWIYP